MIEWTILARDFPYILTVWILTGMTLAWLRVEG